MRAAAEIEATTAREPSGRGQGAASARSRLTTRRRGALSSPRRFPRRLWPRFPAAARTRAPPRAPAERPRRRADPTPTCRADRSSAPLTCGLSPRSASATGSLLGPILERRDLGRERSRRSRSARSRRRPGERAPPSGDWIDPRSRGPRFVAQTLARGQGRTPRRRAWRGLSRRPRSGRPRAAAAPESRHVRGEVLDELRPVRRRDARAVGERADDRALLREVRACVPAVGDDGVVADCHVCRWQGRRSPGGTTSDTTWWTRRSDRGRGWPP